MTRVGALLVDLERTRAWVPWAHFLERVERAATPGWFLGAVGGGVEIVEQWRDLRPVVLDALDAWGLSSTVVRVGDSVDIGEHWADLAGLVRVHAGPDPDGTPDPPAVSRGATVDAYRDAVGRELGLVPSDTLARPLDVRGLREWVGQADDPGAGVTPCAALRWFGPDVACTRRVGHADLPYVLEGPRAVYVASPYPGPCNGVGADLASSCGRHRERDGGCWLDHVHTWRDERTGEPVLTAEPYVYDSGAVLADLDGLPLAVNVVPGRWAGGGQPMLVLRWRADLDPLPAVHRRRFGHPARGWVEQWAVTSS